MHTRSPPLQFRQDRAQQGVVQQVREEYSFGNGSNEARSFAALGRPSELFPEVRIGVGGVDHHRLLPIESESLRIREGTVQIIPKIQPSILVSCFVSIRAKPLFSQA
jgi:hypothetical protein